MFSMVNIIKVLYIELIDYFENNPFMGDPIRS